MLSWVSTTCDKSTDENVKLYLLKLDMNMLLHENELRMKNLGDRQNDINGVTRWLTNIGASIVEAYEIKLTNQNWHAVKKVWKIFANNCVFKIQLYFVNISLFNSQYFWDFPFKLSKI